MTDFTNTDVIAEYASAVEKVLAVQWTGKNAQAMRDLCDDYREHEYGVKFLDDGGTREEPEWAASVLVQNAEHAMVWVRVSKGSWVYRENRVVHRVRILSDEVFRAQFAPVPKEIKKPVKVPHIRRGTINANDLTFEHINCIVSVTHNVIVPNPDGPTLQQVHDFELDMANYEDKLRHHEAAQAFANASPNFIGDVPVVDAPTEPTPLPPVHLEVSAETTGPLLCFTQTEDNFYLTVGGAQLVVERYDYLTVKAVA